jgi:ubiquinone/menaquinone biosynthesis C-methylase UbiE
MVVDEVLAGGPRTILDLGCGTGTLAIKLAKATPRARVIGLDPDADILRRARAKARAPAVRLELLEAMATRFRVKRRASTASSARSSFTTYGRR